jgi:hypothetical protein
MVSDYLIEHENYYNPLTKYLKNTFDRLSDKNSINYLITFSSLEYITDTGLIFFNYERKAIPIIRDFKNTNHFGENKVIAFFQIQTNNFQITNIRSYVKIQDLLSKIGGVCKTLVLLGMFLNYFYSHSFATIDNVYLNHFNSFDDKGQDPDSKSNNQIILKKDINFKKKNIIDVKYKKDSIFNTHLSMKEKQCSAPHIINKRDPRILKMYSSIKLNNYKINRINNSSNSNSLNIINEEPNLSPNVIKELLHIDPINRQENNTSNNLNFDKSKILKRLENLNSKI